MQNLCPEVVQKECKKGKDVLIIMTASRYDAAGS